MKPCWEPICFRLRGDRLQAGGSERREREMERTRTIEFGYYPFDCYYYNYYVLNAFVLFRLRIQMTSFWRNEYTHSRLISRYAINCRFLWSAPVCWAPEKVKKKMIFIAFLLVCLVSLLFHSPVCATNDDYISAEQSLDDLNGVDGAHTVALIHALERTAEGTKWCVVCTRHSR